MGRVDHWISPQRERNRVTPLVVRFFAPVVCRGDTTSGPRHYASSTSAQSTAVFDSAIVRIAQFLRSRRPWYVNADVFRINQGYLFSGATFVLFVS